MFKLRTLVVLALSGLLAACNSFIPDQPVANAFGLDGQRLDLRLVGGEGLVMAVVSDLYRTELAASLDDLDTSEIPGWVDPASLSEVLGLEPEVVVTAVASTAWPALLTVTGAALELRIEDASSEPLEKRFSADGLALRFERQSCGAALTCRYQAQAEGLALMTLLLFGPDLDRLYEILGDGDSPNPVSGSFALTVSSDAPLPSGAILSVTLDTSEGVLTF